MQQQEPTQLERDTDKTMRRIADDIKARCGERYGFAVLVFPFEEDRFGGVTASYISNASREDMIKVLREKADILEAGLDIPI